MTETKEIENQLKTNKLNKEKKIIIFFSLLLLFLWWFSLLFKDTIAKLFEKKGVSVVISSQNQKKEEKLNNWEEEVKINIKEKEIVENKVSDSNLDYLKLKLNSLFPFYEIDEVKEITLEEMIEKKYIDTDLKEKLDKIKDDNLKKIHTYEFEFKIFPLDKEQIIKKALVQGENWDNATKILYQLYERITKTKVDVDIETNEWKKKFLTFITQKLWQDEKLVDKYNQELKKIALFFNNYLLILSEPETKEYVTFKEFLSKKRNILEKLLPIDKLTYFDRFIDYEGTSYQWEQNMIDTIIEQIKNSDIHKDKKLRKSKEIKQLYNDSIDFMNQMRFYKEYLNILETKNIKS